MNFPTRIAIGLLPLVVTANAQAEFLFAPANNNFITPTLNFTQYSRYSEWRDFYSKYTYGNLPDYYATFGGLEVGPNEKVSTPRPDTPEFPYRESYITTYPEAFWDSRNPTITQTSVAHGNISTASKNFYSTTGTQSFRLDDNTSTTSDPDNPSYTTNTVVFQFQTDGLVVDLSQITLIYTSGGIEHSILASELGRAEYLREYRLPEGTSSNPNAAQGYLNRSAIQWDLTGLNAEKYRIEWSIAAHTSFQQAAIDTSDTYVAGIPTSRTWLGGNGSWNESNKWWQYTRSGEVNGSGPVANGNIRFDNSESATIDLNANQTLGEVIFTSEEDVTITTSNGSRFISNTGVTTTAEATGNYAIGANFELAALNLFTINAGKVTMAGVISGAYSLVKSGAGELVLANNNTFTGFLDMQGGKLRIEGSNSYTGQTQLRWGALTIASSNADAALGGHSSVLLGASSSFSDPGETALILEGGQNFSKNIILNTGDYRRIIGARDTGPTGATYSGNISYISGTASDVRLRAEGVNDIVKFTGEIVDLSRANALIIDGNGTVVFTGAQKNFRQTTTVASGTLLVDTTIMNRNVAGNLTVENGATLAFTDNGVLMGTSGGVQNIANLIIKSGGTVTGSGTVTRHTIAEAGAIFAATQGEKLTLASLNVAAGANFEFSLDNPTSIAMEMTGALTVGTAPLNFTFNIGEDFEGGVYSLFTFASISGFTGDYSIFQLSPGSGFALDSSYGNNGWLIDGTTLKVGLAIPEPSTALLMMGAGLGLYLARRRRA